MFFQNNSGIDFLALTFSFPYGDPIKLVLVDLWGPEIHF
jgi:hypothetical protein